MVPLSEGEIIDRLSILEIKQKEIQQTERRSEVEKEVQLYESFFHLKYKFQLYYHLISFVNKRIWDLTDNIKKLDTNHPEYAPISAMIFDYNQQRFRIKNIINMIANSSIKEQKSYTSQTGYVNVSTDDTTILYDVIYCLLHYDTVVVYYSQVSESFKHTIQSIFPTILITGVEHVSTPIHMEECETQQLYEFIGSTCKECLNPNFYI
jgi:hypothetical protein